MRNFAILLLLLNLAYLGWNMSLFGAGELDSEAVLDTRPVADAAEFGLQLLSEVADTSSLANVAELLEEPVESLFTAEGSLASENDLLPETESFLSEAEGFSSGAEGSLSAAEGSLPEAAASLSVAEGSLLVAEGSLLEAEGSPSIIESAFCASIGLFSNVAAGDSAVLALAELGHNAEVVQAEGEPVTYYWLHMPPFNSRAAVSQRLAELQERNIDSYIITDSEGELSQGISLGLFVQRDSALALQAELAAQGFPTRIQEVERRSNEIQVIIDSLSELDFAEVQGLELLKTQSELKLQEKLCETIAPEL